jgi:hypothetical protein
MAVFEEPVVLPSRAPLPMAVFEKLVVEKSALWPTAVLPPPDTLPSSAR